MPSAYLCFLLIVLRFLPKFGIKGDSNVFFLDSLCIETTVEGLAHWTCRIAQLHKTGPKYNNEYFFRILSLFFTLFCLVSTRAATKTISWSKANYHTSDQSPTRKTENILCKKKS